MSRANGHITLNTPVLVRSPKLSSQIRSSQVANVEKPKIVSFKATEMNLTVLETSERSESIDVIET